MSIPDPYKVLQVDPEAEDEVIEAAYKRLARKYHPDVSPEPDSMTRMVQINQAWEMLQDPVRRAAVDRARARAAGTSARVVAADGKARAAAPQAPVAARPAGAGFAFPDMRARSAGSAGPQGERVPSNWTSGRSTEGHRYEARTMGAGAAGAPPGNPSGSIITFGRYEGWTLGEIARTDLEYLEWLTRMPIGRTYQSEIDVLLRRAGRRTEAPDDEGRGRGLFRRR